MQKRDRSLAITLLVALGGCTVQGKGAELETVYAKSTWISRLYQTVLGRDGSDEEIDLWITAMSESELPAASVASKFVNSQEHHNRIVVGIYDRYLKRGADESGRSYWVGALGNGVTVD